MFDLDAELQKWRQGMAAAGLENPDVIRELEEHLREDIEQLVRAGTAEAEAFTRALERLGRPNSLRQEFDLIRQTTVRGVLRSHKWRILLCTAAGCVAAWGYQSFGPTVFVSQAKLFVRAFMAERAPAEGAAPSSPVAVVSPPPEPVLTSIMDGELRLLTSRDLAEQVARSIGPKRMLQNAGGGEDLARAANLVSGGLTVVLHRHSSVLTLSLRHPEKELLQPTLQAVIDQYLRLHLTRNRAAGVPAPGDGRISNISLIQRPSPPWRDTAHSRLPSALLVLAGLLAGVGWALVLAWRFDPPVRPERGIE
jgi:uncharacterized protein involved in exopolysaccharide biosynthesis